MQNHLRANRSLCVFQPKERGMNLLELIIYPNMKPFLDGFWGYFFHDLRFGFNIERLQMSKKTETVRNPWLESLPSADLT